MLVRRSKSTLSNSSFPASIFEKSRMLLMSESRFVAAGANDFGVLALFRGEVRIEQKPRHADDAVHGSADFVAHVGQELALGDIGHFRQRGHFVGTGYGVLELPVGDLQFAHGRSQGILGLFAPGDVDEGLEQALPVSQRDGNHGLEDGHLLVVRREKNAIGIVPPPVPGP